MKIKYIISGIALSAATFGVVFAVRAKTPVEDQCVTLTKAYYADRDEGRDPGQFDAVDACIAAYPSTLKLAKQLIMAEHIKHKQCDSGMSFDDCVETVVFKGK